MEYDFFLIREVLGFKVSGVQCSGVRDNNSGALYETSSFITKM